MRGFRGADTGQTDKIFFKANAKLNFEKTKRNIRKRLFDSCKLKSKFLRRALRRKLSDRLQLATDSYDDTLSVEWTWYEIHMANFIADIIKNAKNHIIICFPYLSFPIFLGFSFNKLAIETLSVLLS